jgi:hypothetical protein
VGLDLARLRVLELARVERALQGGRQKINKGQGVQKKTTNLVLAACVLGAKVRRESVGQSAAEERAAHFSAERAKKKK